MRIVMDMQGAQTESHFRGIGRYTISLVQAIARNRGEHEIILALNGLFPETIESIRAAFDGLLPQSNIRVWYAPGPVRECESGNDWRREVAEHIREAFLASLRPDVLHVFSLFEGYAGDAVTSIGTFAPHIPTVVTLHDLIPLLNSPVYLNNDLGFARHYQRKIEYLKRADKFLAVSESTAAEGRTALSLPADAVINISSGCDEVFRSELAAHGLKQAGKFSWDESARCAIAAYEKLYSARNNNSKFDEHENILPRLINNIAALTPSSLPTQEVLNIAHMLNMNHVDNARRQLFVDISDLIQHDSKTGIQRVTRSILKELLERPPDGYIVEPVYSTIGSWGYRYARGFAARFRGEMNDPEDEPIDYHTGDIFLGLDLQHNVVLNQKYYLAKLRRDGVNVFFVIYDLLPITLPHCFPQGVDAVHKEWLHTLAGFDGLICISRSVADELSVWHWDKGPQRLRPLKIAWFHLGSDINNSVPTRGLSDDVNRVLEEIACRPSFLTVGTIEPRKGHAQILSAFELLWKKGIDANLVIVGKQGWMVKSLGRLLRKHSEQGKRLFWLEGISDEYLEKIYATSTCLIAASEGEGFGLPLIEAAQHKLPIIARDIPVFREVAGDYAFYFKSLEPQALADAVRLWLDLDKQSQIPRTDNMPILTWKQSAEQLMKAVLVSCK